MYLKDELEKYGLVVIAVADPDRAIILYYDLNPDCVIIDIHMKDKNGYGCVIKTKGKYEAALYSNHYDQY